MAEGECVGASVAYYREGNAPIPAACYPDPSAAFRNQDLLTIDAGNHQYSQLAPEQAAAAAAGGPARADPAAWTEPTPIYGSYGGELIFLESMTPAAWVDALVADAARACVPMPGLPARAARGPTFLPRQICFDATAPCSALRPSTLWPLRAGARGRWRQSRTGTTCRAPRRSTRPRQARTRCRRGASPRSRRAGRARAQPRPPPAPRPRRRRPWRPAARGPRARAWRHWRPPRWRDVRPLPLPTFINICWKTYTAARGWRHPINSWDRIQQHWIAVASAGRGVFVFEGRQIIGGEIRGGGRESSASGGAVARAG
jgi:hypothetical protein